MGVLAPSNHALDSWPELSPLLETRGVPPPERDLSGGLFKMNKLVAAAASLVKPACRRLLPPRRLHLPLGRKCQASLQTIAGLYSNHPLDPQVLGSKGVQQETAARVPPCSCWTPPTCKASQLIGRMEE